MPLRVPNLMSQSHLTDLVISDSATCSPRGPRWSSPEASRNPIVLIWSIPTVMPDAHSGFGVPMSQSHRTRRQKPAERNGSIPAVPSTAS